MVAVRHELDADGVTVTQTLPQLDAISGMAPKCRLVSLKVLDEFGMGRASNVIAAIAHVQLINGHGRDLKIHGVNLSLGYTFDPKWFACGQSPLCVEVNRLVRSGVVVVVAAGNTGYGSLQTAEGDADVGLDMTINDPGNAELAITVGSTHRDMPHSYGVSYFSSKGPTGDGRCKPDLLAPGEKILSCAAAGSEAAAPRGARAPNAALLREQRHQHGGAARLRRHRRVPVDPPRVHRRGGEGQGRSSPRPRPTSAATAISRARGWST